MVALLVGRGAAEPISRRLRGCDIHVPAHFDAEVLSALGRLHRAGEIKAREVSRDLDILARAPFERHHLAPLLEATWKRRGDMRLVDAAYVALAESLAAPILTLDRGLAAAAPSAELISI
jgi:predicted nucleic acid-binding protein